MRASKYNNNLMSPYITIKKECDMPHSTFEKTIFRKYLRWPLAIALLAASFFSIAAPPAPDYSKQTSWVAWPGRPGPVDTMPVGVIEKRDLGVDVFFVHPTSYLSSFSGNANFDAGGTTGSGVINMMKRQASAFNGCCQIYAPRYRQASTTAITGHSTKAYAANELAYSDVERAFDAFIAANNGRPFIIAGHSQGSIHALRLLQQRIAGTSLQQRMVAAYIVGAALPLEVAQLIPICETSQQTGCMLAWNSVTSYNTNSSNLQSSVLWWLGQYQPMGKLAQLCVNPLDWYVDSAADAKANLGSVYSFGKYSLWEPAKGKIAAHCENGWLGVNVPWALSIYFSDLLTFAGFYHDFDYRLFYMNIRANAIERSQAWLAGHQS